MRVALASYRGEEDPVPQDLLVAAALQSLGHESAHARWSDENFPWDSYDAVAVRSCWDYHLHYAAFTQWIGRLESAGINLVNKPSLIHWNVNKRYLAELHAKGIAIPDTAWIDAPTDIAALRRERGWDKAVVKPLVSASAYRTELRVDGIAAGPAMAQEFLPEIQTEGEWSLMYFHGRFSHAIHKITAPGDFRVQKEFGGRAMTAAAPIQGIAFAHKVLEAAPELPAIARVDLVITARRGPVLMELEVIEPELFLDEESAAKAAQAITK